MQPTPRRAPTPVGHQAQMVHLPVRVPNCGRVRFGTLNGRFVFGESLTGYDPKPPCSQIATYCCWSVTGRTKEPIAAERTGCPRRSRIAPGGVLASPWAAVELFPRYARLRNQT